MKITKVLLERTQLRPEVPDWIVRWAVPELEDLGPQGFEPDCLFDYCPEVAPELTADFFGHLLAENLLKQCLGLQEGMALISQGIFQTERFRKKHLCLWRSAAINSCGSVFMPWVQNISGQEAVIRWWWFEYPLYISHCTFLWNMEPLPCLCSLVATPAA